MPEDKIDYNLEVVVRCGYCGALWGFFPHRVMHLRECHCGNGSWGRPKDWLRDSFGDFDLVIKQSTDLYKLLGISKLLSF